MGEIPQGKTKMDVLFQVNFLKEAANVYHFTSHPKQYYDIIYIHTYIHTYSNI